jgi:hypothetical protein
MRFCVPTALLCAILTAPVFAVAHPPPAPLKTPAATPAASAPVASAPAPAPAPGDSDAAARHAKLTECLKEAKTRKLIAPDKTAFIKDCTSKP